MSPCQGTGTCSLQPWWHRACHVCCAWCPGASGSTQGQDPMGRWGNTPDAKNLSPSPKPGWEKEGVQGSEMSKLRLEHSQCSQKHSGRGRPWVPLGMAVAPMNFSHPMGDAHKPQSPRGDAHKPQGLQEEVRDQRGKARRSTHTPLHPSPA